MLFPVMLVVMIGIRKALDRYFSQRELKALDDILPEFKRKERDEVEEENDGDEYDADGDASIGNRGYPCHEEKETGFPDMEDGVKRADGISPREVNLEVRKDNHF